LPGRTAEFPAEIAFDAQTERQERFLVSLALVRRQCDVVAIEFDNYGAERQCGFMGFQSG
jgi:hypothetical protein